MEIKPMQTFRDHRHHVLNELQLVRAYIQMSRPEAAIHVVDRLTSWYRSIGDLQSSCTEGLTDLVWTAAACSHLRIDCSELLKTTSPTPLLETIESLFWLNEQAVMNDLGPLSVRAALQVTQQAPSETFVLLEVSGQQDLSSWWHTVDVRNFQPTVSITTRITRPGSIDEGE